MLKKNIKYKSREILDFYSSSRQHWDEFYPSERWVFEKVFNSEKSINDVLDIGCACGGLGLTLHQRFPITSYTGVDIHKDAIAWAVKNQKFSILTKFIAGDILKLKLENQYDAVVSLSCADFNIETNAIIRRCWDLVKPDGYFIISLRLTNKKSINDIRKSYQYINFSRNAENPDICNYAVFNFIDILNLLQGLIQRPRTIGVYGYWGKPSPTAVTPFKKLVFAVFYIKKEDSGINDVEQQSNAIFNLPLDFLQRTILE